MRTLGRSLYRTNLPAYDFDSESHQPLKLAASLRISFCLATLAAYMNARRLNEILERAKAKRLLVIGDLMLDEFVWGKVGRISPEAPVPVVEVTGESLYPGGAANVARNLREFIEGVAVVGLIGSDPGGRRLGEALAGQKIDNADVIADAEFRTIVKTRIIARNQQIVRVDREQIRSPSTTQVSRIAENVRRR